MPDDGDVAVIAHLKCDLSRWCTRFLDDGYDIMVIVMVRDPWVQERSRAKAAGKGLPESRARYDADYRAAFGAIMDGGLSFRLVSYECLLWKGAVERILSLWDLQPLKPLMVQGKITEIRDENGKWYA